MCCLGFDCKFLNDVNDNQLYGIGYPSNWNIPSSFDDNTQRRLAYINDRSDGVYRKISNEEQEKLITEEFLKVGIEVTFVE